MATDVKISSGQRKVVKNMNYEKMFNDVIETLSEDFDILQTQLKNIEDELNEAVKGGDLEKQLECLKELPICFGKIKILNDIRCLMTEMKGGEET